MNAEEVLRELESLGSEKMKAMLMKNHGVREPCFGVKIGDMQPLRKQIGKDYQLALDLYQSGNYDAMYLAGLIADDDQMTKKDLQGWVNAAYGAALPGTTVASVAAGSAHGWEMALKWIDSSNPNVASAGWSTLSSLVALKEDAELDLGTLQKLLQRASEELPEAPDIVRYHMNGFLIAAGCYVTSLTELALELGKKVGPITADLGNNQCQIPYIPDYIRKVQQRKAIGKKKKSVKC